MTKRILFVVGLLLALLAFAGTLLLLSLPQGAPWAQPGPGQRPSASMAELKTLMQREALMQALQGQPVSLDLPEDDLNGVAQDLSDRLLRGGARVALADTQATLEASVPIAATPLRLLRPFGNWLNARVVLRTQPTGAPMLDSVTLGRVQVPPALALWVTRQVLAQYDLLEPVTLGLSALDEVRFDESRLKVRLKWDDNLQGQTLALAVPPEDWPRLVVYHQVVADTLTAIPKSHRGAVPLHQLIGPVFRMAQHRTTQYTLAASSELEVADLAARENRAALVVLAAAVNRVMLQELLPPGMSDIGAMPGASIRLRGREDFAQHFTVSALTALALGSRVADTIGLYKEMMDANKADGGSGFSFNDLALNRAGIRLGQRARQDPVGLQFRLGGDAPLTRDDDFVPNVDDLPEFLDRPQFMARFGGLKDRRFEAVMQDVDKRVSGLPALN